MSVNYFSFFPLFFGLPHNSGRGPFIPCPGMDPHYSGFMKVNRFFKETVFIKHIRGGERVGPKGELVDEYRENRKGKVVMSGINFWGCLSRLFVVGGEQKP
jgi:hypothetical protein